MAFCKNCGTELENGLNFCPQCGTNNAPAAAPAAPIAPEAPKADPKDIADTRILALQAYLGILVLEPIFAAPKGSKYARFHANQGLILAIIDGIVAFTGGILSFLATLHVVLAVLFLPAVILMSAAVVYLAVIGIINAIKGEMKELPYVGKFRILH